MNEEQFLRHLAERGIELSEEQIRQFRRYYELLVEWNEKMNLTAITDRDQVYLKHFLDSVSVAFRTPFDGKLTVCDVGAGAGFPSIPLKICFPELRVTIIDSLNKRITFLNELGTELGLDGVRFVHARAEEAGRNPEFREAFDVVTARAVARLPVLAELCLPLVKEGGRFISMKAAAAEEELDEAQFAVKTLGGRLSDSYSFLLPVEESERNIFVFDKVAKTPKKYPRKPGTPGKQPLVR
ncbi:16S rRNA (guanine(527)-N(7))-methyltransferase RsmG [Edaphobacillus lindanitolerans]|uniref:Ribosomal RNA small subunit methyltransferase G n=1 Tax=Edaphobacillus lindanitolerans TaxID=550447 RepID=A0A1U7PKT1_9BACI|nr:16S rRNA (guanine(527)-N(7))-methyltransferase RsmG [Edaphobacillus lindanitolerans]SIT87053.1 16S rRNA m(7)G-527 methyltransferase [Edaphobacillus lindanitolerans]